MPYYDGYLFDDWFYTILSTIRSMAVYMIVIILILFIAMVPTILIGIGKTRYEEGVHLDFLDELSIEIVIFMAILMFLISMIFFVIGSDFPFFIALVFMSIGVAVVYVTCIVLFETIVKRIKTHTFVQKTFLYWLCKQINMAMNHMKTSVKVVIFLLVFLVANLIGCCIVKKSILGIFLLIALYGLTFFYIMQKIATFQNIKNALKEIYQGNTNTRLNVEEYKEDLKEVAIYVNDIAGGLSNAVSEQVKSERLKTELITNVSHDIKTPLTSIINYIDLLKKDGITNERAEEYLTILDNKSQRLKKLTEDLVEASKASSGNLKLTMEKLEVNELIKQVSGEFEDKFKSHVLEEIVTFSKEPIYIYADNRYLYRVLENMYSNVAKYAMEQTRVYTDIIDNRSSVIIQIKNISKDKLNITAEELMQRFVRGDSSRNTEGSGLGLSIATSLTQLQGGKFQIHLDGDLFKVTIEFEKMKINESVSKQESE